MTNDEISDHVKEILRQVDAIKTDDITRIQILKTAANQINESVMAANLRQMMYNALTKR